MKKIIKTLLVAMIIAMVVMVFAACQKDEPIVNPCANGHTMETFGEDLPTCTEDGLSAGVVCTVCGYAERTRFPIPAKGHKMADATCEDPSTCTVCGYTEGEALGHDMASVEALEPTCTTEGYNAHLGCTRCDYTEGKEVVEINPDAHTLVDVEALEPGCEDRPGYTAHKACECGYTEGYEVVTVEGHDFNEEELFYYPSAPTCTEGAYIAGYCTSCGEGFLLEEVPALGHADEDANGICDRCEAELHTHNLVDVVGKSATCTEAGYTAHKACECGYTEGYEVLPAGHVVDAEGVCTGCGNVLVATGEQLVAAMAAGKNVLLVNDIVMDATLKCPYGNSVGVAQKGGVLDGNGFTLTVNGSGNYYAIITYGGTIKNLTINSGFRAIVLYTPTEDVIIDNVTIYGDDIVYGLNTAEYPTLEGIDIVVKNSTICGWVSFAGDYASVTFENCEFIQGVAYDNAIGRLVRPYLSTTFTNCTFVKNAYLDLSALGAGETVTLVGCTVDGVEVTVDAFTTTEDDAEIPFTYEAPAGVEMAPVAVEGGVSFHRHAHSYEEVVTAPTCTAAGYTTYTCACGDTYTDGETEALGHADENGDYKCDRCSTKMLPPDGTTLTVEQALAVAQLGGSAYTTQKYYITGIVTNVYNTTYGNLYLKDADGNKMCIYGLYTWDKAVRYDKMDYKPVEGDELTVYTVLGTYDGTAQGKDAWMDDVVAHEHDYKDVVTEPTCTKAGFTTHTCTICNGYVVDTEVEALGHTTESGECERCGQTIGGDAPAFETFTADFGTLTANSSYSSYKTTSGWQGTNCAVVQGGSSDSNPTFKVLGNATTKGFVLNGNTSAKGKLVSPTLTGGISYLTFNFTNVFSESNGVDITITIKQNGTAVATKKLDQNSVTQLTAYTFEWDLAGEGVAVTGDFTIEITNNSPSNNSSKNKDRVAIWNLEWTNNPVA